MEIKCTVEELKELIQNKTPVATTTYEMAKYISPIIGQNQ